MQVTIPLVLVKERKLTKSLNKLSYDQLVKAGVSLLSCFKVCIFCPKVYATATEDMDSLTFGSLITLRHMTFSEARFVNELQVARID